MYILHLLELQDINKVGHLSKPFLTIAKTHLICCPELYVYAEYIEDKLRTHKIMMSYYDRIYGLPGIIGQHLVPMMKLPRNLRRIIIMKSLRRESEIINPHLIENVVNSLIDLIRRNQTTLRVIDVSFFDYRSGNSPQF
jgi:hypothetical protein